MRNVFLTGGSRGIGAATVLALARAGYNVAFTYHAHPEAAKDVAAQARALSPAGTFLPICADAGDSAQVCAAVAQAEEAMAVCRCLSAMRASPSKSCLPTLPTRIGTA